MPGSIRSRSKTSQPSPPPSSAGATDDIGALRESLLAWYDRCGRALAWRPPAGAPADPYRVWVSEIMLQQTTAAAVEPYFERFLARWPRVENLAAAELDDVLHAWQGLGYYARARNMHACAQAVAAGGGRFPDSEEALRALPGIGAYTAAALAAIAFGRQAAPVDGNVVRVLARLDAVMDPLPAARTAIAARAAMLAPARRPGDFAQALMDLGATVCTPRSPKCAECPWNRHCAARARGDPQAFPRRATKKNRPVRYGVAFWLQRDDGAVLLRKRPPRGLLGGMMEVPSSEWRSKPWTADEAAADAPPGADGGWRAIDGLVAHTFTHFHLELSVLLGRTGRGERREKFRDAGVWADVSRLETYALPTLMKKIADLVCRRGAATTGATAAANSATASDNRRQES